MTWPCGHLTSPYSYSFFYCYGNIRVKNSKRYENQTNNYCVNCNYMLVEKADYYLTLALFFINILFMMNHKMLPSLRHLLLQEKKGEKREKELKIMLNSVINFFLVFHKFTSTLVRPKYFYHECIKILFAYHGKVSLFLFLPFSQKPA